MLPEEEDQNVLLVAIPYKVRSYSQAIMLHLGQPNGCLRIQNVFHQESIYNQLIINKMQKSYWFLFHVQSYFK